MMFMNKSKYYIKKLAYLKTWLYQKGIFISALYMWQDWLQKVKTLAFSEAAGKVKEWFE